jgi:hypothetical protein
MQRLLSQGNETLRCLYVQTRLGQCPRKGTCSSRVIRNTQVLGSSPHEDSIGIRGLTPIALPVLITAAFTLAPDLHYPLRASDPTRRRRDRKQCSWRNLLSGMRVRDVV